MHWIWAPATVLLLQVAPPRRRPRLLTCCDTKRSAYTRSLSCSHSLPHIAGLQHKARHGYQVNETRLWCPACSLQVIEDAQFIISDSRVDNLWQTHQQALEDVRQVPHRELQKGTQSVSVGL